MVRFLALGVVLALVYGAFHYSFNHFPGPEPTTVRWDAADDLDSTDTNRPGDLAFDDSSSPVDALGEATVNDSAASIGPTGGTAWSAGIYSIADSNDPAIAKSDRDYRARKSIFDTDDEESELAARHQGELVPGLYTTSFDTNGCSYELWRVMKDRKERIIGEDYLANGRMLATINGIEPDWFTSTDECGTWVEWQPLAQPLTAAVDGDYWIGDLAPGEWQVPKDCRWEKVSGFRGNLLSDVIENGSGPGRITIDATTFGVRVRGCTAPMARLES